MFPGLAHMYGPKPGTRWDELYVIFDGPAFDSWRALGVLNPASPVVTPPAHVNIPQRLRGDCANTECGSRNNAGSSGVLYTYASMRSLATHPSPGARASPKAWVTKSCSLLAQTGPDGPTLEEIAERMNVSIATFGENSSPRSAHRPHSGAPDGAWKRPVTLYSTHNSPSPKWPNSLDTPTSITSPKDLSSSSESPHPNFAVKSAMRDDFSRKPVRYRGRSRGSKSSRT